MRSRTQRPPRKGSTARSIRPVVAAALLLGAAGWTAQSKMARPAAPAVSLASATERTSSSGSSFEPTVSNTAPAPRPAPDGMLWIPGGEFSMGAGDPPGKDGSDVGMNATQDSRPIHRVSSMAFTWTRQT